MHNQHAGLSQTLAEQHITQQQERLPRRGWRVALAHSAVSAGRGP